MQRPPLFEANCFIYWKNRFETYVKSKDVDLWYIIAHGNYKPTTKDKDGKDVVTPYEKLDENQKKMLSKNDEAKMVLYNALSKKEYERIFMCDMTQNVWDSLITTHQGNKQVKDNKIDLFVQKYEEFSITDDETIDCAFSRFNTIITSLKALDESFSSRNHVRKFLRALPSKWRPKNKKEKYKSLALKAKQVLSDDDTSSSDSNDEEYAMAVRDFKKFFRRRGKFVRQPYDDKKNFQKIKEEKREDQRCFKCGDPNHFISDCPKNYSGEQKAFVVGSWSDSGDDSKKEEICLMGHSNEVLSDNLYYSSSSLDNESRQNDFSIPSANSSASISQATAQGSYSSYIPLSSSKQHQRLLLSADEVNHSFLSTNAGSRNDWWDDSTVQIGNYHIPLYSRFKQVEYKGVPHPLSGDYTPREQEDIDDSLYEVWQTWNLKPKSPSPTVSNASSIVFSICPSNDSDGELGNSSLKHMEHRGILIVEFSGPLTGNRAHLEDYQELSKEDLVTVCRKPNGGFFYISSEKDCLQEMTHSPRPSTSTPNIQPADDINELLEKNIDALALQHLRPSTYNQPTRTKGMRGSIWSETKPRLVAQVHRQEEQGFIMMEVLHLVARIEATVLFLALPHFLGFIVYQMDVKSAFLYGTIDEEVYVSQPPGFVDPDHPTKLHTPMETKLPLTKDEEAFDSRCTLVTPKTSHLNAVKRIFKYLKGKPNLGLWYPRESPLDLEAFSDSDYGGSNLDRKSTTGGCQFLGQRLISWQCKKQTIVATSTTEAEYVAVANCYGQVLWVQNQLLDYGFNFMNTKIHIDNESTICIVKNPVYHSKTKHIEIRHHFIRDCYEKKLISVEKIHTDLNVADLLTKPFDGPRFHYLVVSIGQEHAAQAQSQPSPTPPPIPSPTPPPIPSPTPTPIPTPPLPPSPSPKSPPPPPPPETAPITDESLYEEHSPAHHHFSPSQARPKSHAYQSEDEELRLRGGQSSLNPSRFFTTRTGYPPTTKAHASGEEQKEEITKHSTVGENKGQRERKAPMLSEETPNKTKEQDLTKEVSPCRSNKIDSLQKKRRTEQIHLDALLAQRMQKKKSMTEQQKKRNSQQEETNTGTETPLNPVPVAMKTPSVATYKIIKQGEKGVYQIVREDGTDIVYINFGAMLKSISRDDLTELYRIVMNRYGLDGPEDS
ncbi:putative ribonuclease H-like domain-containing protein [Tanacetum coccineum]|uniref:Ribonuclease H-like domain-containing protein n=1 Tax=Tanacetum coccineum TaxID=301880 RepID=A0ABQ5DA30_9ASTR